MTTKQDNKVQVQYINPEQGKRCLALGWMSKVPALFVGGPGTAKTTIHREFVNAGKGFNLWVCITSRMDPGDFGVPVPDQESGTVSYFVPAFLPFDEPKARGVLFLDELDRATPEMQNAALQLALDRYFHGHVLGEDVYVSAACNGASDIYTTALSEAARTRFMSLFISAHAPGYSDSWQKWADAAGLTAESLAFRKYRSEHVARRETFEELAVCNDRTIEMADRLYKASKEAKFRTDDILFQCIAGVIGVAAATEYLAISRMLTEAPTPDEILKDPKGAKLPENQSIIYALGVTLVREADSREKAGKFAEYAIRLTPELTASILKQLSQKVPAVCTNAEVLKWINTHQALMI